MCHWPWLPIVRVRTNCHNSLRPQLIRGFLARETEARLGSGPGGRAHVRAHAFFRGVHWERAMAGKLKPPMRGPAGVKPPAVADPALALAAAGVGEADATFPGFDGSFFN
jgi:hypothetical protein